MVFAAFGLEQRVDPGPFCLGGLNWLRRHGRARAVMRRIATGNPTPHETLRCGICAQTIGAMQRYTRHFTCCPNVFYECLTLDIGMYAAHGVMCHRADGNRLLDGIESDVFNGHFTDEWETLENALAAEVAQIQVNVIQPF